MKGGKTMKVSSRKRIVNCAITGAIHVPSMSDYLPITPDEIAQSAIEAADAGAATVHIHVRDPKTGEPTNDLGLFREVVDQIRAVNEDVIICFTTGGKLGSPVESRAAVVPEFKPELASMNAGSINWGLFRAKDRIESYKNPWEEEFLTATEDLVFQNSFLSMKKMLSMMDAAGTKPELEVYDVGQLYNIKFMLDKGYLKAPLYIQFVTGINGGIQSNPYDLMNLHTTADRLFGAGQYNWCVIGAGKAEYEAAMFALLLGGHARVGLEDNLYLKYGQKAKTNAEMVEKMIRIMKEFDLEPATPSEARQILEIQKKNIHI